MTDIVESTEEFLIRRVRKQQEEIQDLEAKLKQSIALLNNITVNDNETSMTMIRDWLMENQ